MRPAPFSTLSAVIVIVVLLSVACGSGADDTASDQDRAATTSGTPTETTEATDLSTEPTDAEAADTAVAEAEVLFPDVVGVEAIHDGDGQWTFNVTLSSPYDSPERYADAWRVMGPGGTVYGERILLHDHAGEQPFTRSQSGIAIPDDVSTVTVEGRDQVSGWGGRTMDVTLER